MKQPMKCSVCKQSDIGSGKVVKTEGDIAELSILRSTKEVLGGDRLLPSEERAINAIFYPSSPENEIDGKIIDIEGGVSQYGPMNVVLIDKGRTRRTGSRQCIGNFPGR
jgi:hypothetical protein